MDYQVPVQLDQEQIAHMEPIELVGWIFRHVTEVWKRMAHIMDLVRNLPQRIKAQAIEELSKQFDNGYVEWIKQFILHHRK